MQPGAFLSFPEHAGLLINTDDVQTFNSSNHSIWPVYLMISNLPPELRMNENFLILASIWFGPKKPADITPILKPVIATINKLLETGIEVLTPVGTKKSEQFFLLEFLIFHAKQWF